MESKQTGVGYLLLGLSVFGFAGLHRFYLGRPVTGFLYLITWGFLGLGSFVDLFLLPGMVREENLRLGFFGPDFRQLHSGGSGRALPAGRTGHPAPPPPDPEQAILQAAKADEACLTVAGAAVATGLSLRKAERLLERMVRDGYAERDVSEDGARLYVFPGLRSNKPFDLDTI